MKRFCIMLALLASIATSCFAWDKATTYGIPKPSTTTEKVIWFTGTALCLGAGIHTMMQNPNDSISFVTGFGVSYVGITGIKISLLEW